MSLEELQRRSLQSLAEGKCGCWHCLSERGDIRIGMIVCPDCGNKRCPKASDHRLECSGSNLPGQTGSVYQ